MHLDTSPKTVLSKARPNRGGTMVRNGQRTVIPAGQPTAGASATRAMGQPAARPATPNAGGKIYEAGDRNNPRMTVLPSPAMGRGNLGGEISTQVAPNVRAKVVVGGSPAQNTNPNRPNAGGTMVRGGRTTVVPPGQPTAGATATRAPAAAPAVAAPPPAAPVTPPAVPDSAAPAAAAPAVATPPPAPPAAQNLGFSSRGASAPTGTDAEPQDANVGGTGLYSKRFSSPTAAKLYNDYVQRIFGGAMPSSPPTI